MSLSNADLSVLDPDSIITSSTPRLFKQRITRTMTSRDNQTMHSKTQDVDAASAYSIHLSAIDPASASSTLDLDVEITRLESEDVGGPSDFTQNLAEWINGTNVPSTLPVQTVPVQQRSPRPASSRHQAPKVEDCDTPKVSRSIVVEKQDMKRVTDKQQANGDVAEDENKTSDWQALCLELQRKNEQLSKNLEMNRVALAELKYANSMSDASRIAEGAQLANQVAVWEAGGIRSLVGTASSNETRTIDAAGGQPPQSIMQKASTALVEQQKRITELEAALVKDRQLQPAVSGDVKTSHQPPPKAYALDSSQEQIAALREKLAAADTQREKDVAAVKEEYHHVATSMDEWVLSKVKEKDDQHAASLTRRDKKIAELKTRNAELERLYMICGKELMLTWGREECGAVQPGEKQLYRYRHALRGTM